MLSEGKGCGFEGFIAKNVSRQNLQIRSAKRRGCHWHDLRVRSFWSHRMWGLSNPGEQKITARNVWTLKSKNRLMKKYIQIFAIVRQHFVLQVHFTCKNLYIKLKTFNLHGLIS